jgi:hypothetical protein
MRASWLVLGAALLASSGLGCTGFTDVYHFRTAVVAPRPPALPQVYMRGAPPPAAPFVEIAVLQARSNDSFPAAVAALQQHAAGLGADALVDVRGESGSFETSVLGTAIVWTDPVAPRSQR